MLLPFSSILVCFPVAVIQKKKTKHSDKHCSREYEFISAHSARVHAIMAGESRQQELEATGYITSVIGKRSVRNPCILLLSFPSPFMTREWCCPQWPCLNKHNRKNRLQAFSQPSLDSVYLTILTPKPSTFLPLSDDCNSWLLEVASSTRSLQQAVSLSATALGSRCQAHSH